MTPDTVRAIVREETRLLRVAACLYLLYTGAKLCDLFGERRTIPAEPFDLLAERMNALKQASDDLVLLSHHVNGPAGEHGEFVDGAPLSDVPGAPGAFGLDNWLQRFDDALSRLEERSHARGVNHKVSPDFGGRTPKDGAAPTSTPGAAPVRGQR